MPRAPRPVVPGQPLHIVQRGVNRAACFATTDDFHYYRHVLRVVSEREGCEVHAYVLMTNHVHLLLTPRDARAPARMMQAIGRWYVRYFNERQGRIGTLWQGRYRSTLVDSERYFFACSRYVELNPVRAGMTSRPDTYGWSSFRCNAYGDTDPVITHHAVYRSLGATPHDRQMAYRALFATPQDVDVVAAIRRATNTGTILATRNCRVQIEATLRRRLTRFPHGGDRRSPGFQAITCAGEEPPHRNRFSTMLTP